MAQNNLKRASKYSLGKLAVKCFSRSVIVSIMAFLLYAFLTVIVSGMTTKELGYTIMYSADGENFEDVYIHNHTDDCFDENGCDDEKYTEYTAKPNYYKTTTRSEVSKKNTALTRWIAQLASLGILYIIIYTAMWQAGDSNANMSEMGNIKREKYKGIKAGLIADIPYALLYIFLAVTSAFKILPNFPGIYKIATYFMFGFNDTFIPVVNESFVITVGGIIGAAVVLLPIPLFAAFGYHMGQKHIIFKEKIVYKKEG